MKRPLENDDLPPSKRPTVKAFLEDGELPEDFDDPLANLSPPPISSATAVKTRSSPEKIPLFNSSLPNQLNGHTKDLGSNYLQKPTKDFDAPTTTGVNTMNDYLLHKGHTAKEETVPIPPRHALNASKTLTGCSPISDYELSVKVGEGTFGEVHKARRKKDGLCVALKRILTQNEKDGFPVTAMREIKILKALNHTNVINLLDIAVDSSPAENSPGGTFTASAMYMVFPYMDHDLSGLLDNPSVKFSVPQIKLYLSQLLEGTFYMHANKILHRDMKAANLLIDNQGILKIADFGLARPYNPDEHRDYTNCVVTRWYRPPELLLGEKAYTEAIDMWGVGCVFGEILLGHPMLPGNTDLDQLNQIFKLVGTPSEESWPNWTTLPGMDGVEGFKQYKPTLRERFSEHGELAIDLLEKLLTLDPSKRLSASAALDHEYFWTNPLPAKPSSLPRYEASHEYDKRRRKDDRAVKAPDAPHAYHGGQNQTYSALPGGGYIGSNGSRASYGSGQNGGVQPGGSVNRPNRGFPPPRASGMYGVHNAPGMPPSVGGYIVPEAPPPIGHGGRYGGPPPSHVSLVRLNQAVPGGAGMGGGGGGGGYSSSGATTSSTQSRYPVPPYNSSTIGGAPPPPIYNSERERHQGREYAYKDSRDHSRPPRERSRERSHERSRHSGRDRSRDRDWSFDDRSRERSRERYRSRGKDTERDSYRQHGDWRRRSSDRSK